MDSKVDAGPTLFDAVKLIVASVILVGSMVGYYYYANESALLRAIGVLVAIIVAMSIVYRSYQGQMLWKFIQGSRVEMRKVVWPTREETIQTTAVVLVFAAIGGIFFWLLDLFLLWVTQSIMG
jgi:preprotein translocase subunit SecE